MGVVGYFMKKLLLFFTFFLLFAALSAEEAKNNTETVSQAGETADVSRETPVKKTGLPEWLYIQPLLSAGIIHAGDDERIFSAVFNASVQFDFRIAHMKNGNNIYLGVDLGFKYHHSLYKAWDIPLLSNVVFDFKTSTKNDELEYVSLWLAFGVGIGHYDPYYVDIISTDAKWDGGGHTVRHSWGIGTDLKFKNGIVLQFAVKSLAFANIIPLVGLGYRF